MANLPKLPTISGFFTWLKAKVIRITGTEGDIELKEKTESLGGKMIGLVNSDENGYIVVDENSPAVNQGGAFRFGIGNWRAHFFGTSYGICPGSDDSSKIGESGFRWHEAHIGTGGIYSDGKITVNSAIVFNLPRQSSPPADPATDDIYFDDGTNTADGKPHLRAWNGSAWEDL